jgi:hypothetical protein
MSERCPDCGTEDCAAGLFGYRATADQIAVCRLRAKITKLEAERDEWRTSASMACENPPPRCDCAGCRFAEQYRAEEAAKAELEKVR